MIVSRFKPGDTVEVDFGGDDVWWSGEVLRVDDGYVLCRVWTDPLWDFGSASSRVMPEQIIAVPVRRVRGRAPVVGAGSYG